MQTWQIHCGDALAVLQTLQAESVHCVVTSPPYFGLRDYGTGRWEGGDSECSHLAGTGGNLANSVASVKGGGHKMAEAQSIPFRGDCGRCGAIRIDNQIGLESSPQAYVSALVTIFREVRRVLRDDGVCWLNLGDSYGSSGGDTYSGFNERYFGRPSKDDKQADTAKTLPKSPKHTGLRPKNLLGIPWRVALALQSDGWWLRSDVIWHKKSCMPESVTDRPTRSHEYVFLLTKSARYWYDADAIREPYARIWGDTNFGDDNMLVTQIGRDVMIGNGHTGIPLSRPKKREVYTGQATKDYDSAGAQDPSDTKRRVLETMQAEDYLGANARTVWSLGPEPSTLEHFAVMPRMLARRCILAGCPFDGVVFDPFAGTGTTGVVALEEGRHFVGIELNAKYHAIARERLANVAPLLATEVGA